jgi:ubiquinone/menaquinone biosynthesis C-methylase UbiE
MTDDVTQGDPTDERVAALAAFYDGSAIAYRDVWAPVLLPMTNRLLDRLPLGPAGTILDVGTGVGLAAPEIRARARSAFVVGVDRSIGMLRLVEGEQSTALMDAMRLAFADGVADVAILSFMLFHVPEPLGALREAHRVLRADGAIGVTTWGQEAEALAWDIWTEELDAVGAPAREPSAIANHDQMDTPEKLASLLTDAGFSNVTVDVVPLGHKPDLEAFLELQTRCSARKRLDPLPPRLRETCINRATARLRSLPAADLEDRSEVLLATGRR